MSSQDEIKVSVCVVTYNQERYIAECLQSLVDQETDFPFEIIVGEDCSTDRTRDIVEEFARKYPDLIVRNFHEKNIGAVDNMVSSYRLAKGRYICHVDGDDYAMPGKLQTQFDILEAHPECIICSHDVKQIDKNGKLIRSSFREKDEGVYQLIDLYQDLPFFAHSSKMFVNDLNESYWNHLHEHALDIEVHVEQAKHGDIYHLTEALGVYRLDAGISSSSRKVNTLLVKGTERIFDSAINDGVYKSSVIKRFYAKSLFNYAYQSAIYGNPDDLLLFIKKSIHISKFDLKQRFFFMLSIFPSALIMLCRSRAKLRGFQFYD